MAVSFLMYFRSFAWIQSSQKKGEQTRKKQNRVRDRRIVRVNEQMASNMTLVTLNQWQATKERRWPCHLRMIPHNQHAKKEPLTIGPKLYLELQCSPTGLKTVATRYADQLE